jgi:fimbrial chaperone protein
MTKLSLIHRCRALALAPALAALLAALPARAAEFSVTPIRVDLKPGAMSETITVTHHGSARLRLAVKLQEWTQDATGADVYKDSADLIYFPRQLEMEPDSKRLVRVGLKTPAGVVEKSYRLFIEEEPGPATEAGRAQVAFYFRFGVPVFLPPAVAHAEPEVAEPTLRGGKVSVVVRNTGNTHFRLTKVSLADGAGFTKEAAGWYSLAGTQRTYTLDVPREVCIKAKTLDLSLEGEGIRVDRKLNVDPANCA